MIIDSPIISGSYLSTGSLSQTGNVSITGSLTATAGISGSFSGSGADLFGIPATGITGLNLSQIASGSASASVSPNNGFVVNTNTKISGSTQITGSLGVTGSFSVSGSTGTVFSSNADSLLITGSLVVTGSTIITGSLSVSGSITGSLEGTASYSLFALTSSYSLGGSGFPFSGSAVITGSLLVSGSAQITGSLSVSGSISASLFGTASQATSASYALTASYLLGYISPFPFTGSAAITGSLIVTGSVAISTLTTGSGVRYVIADQNGLLSAQTASAAIFTTQQVVSTAGQTTFPITNGYATGYVTVFVNGTKLSADEYVDTSGTNIIFLTGSTAGDNVEFQKYLPAAGVSNNTLRSTNYFTATTGQTDFTVNYTPGLIDIFYNGAKLDNTEYTAANGTSITLATASAAGDRLEVDVYSYQVGAFSGIGGTGAANQLAYFNTSNSITGSNAFTVSGSAVIITGSLTVSGSGTFTNIGPAVFSGSVTAVGGFSGSFSGNADSASLAQNSLLLQGTGSIGFATTASLLAVSSSQQQISASLLTLTASYTALSSSYTALSGSYNTYSSSVSTRTTQIEQVYATTGSNSFRANQSITGSLVVSSTITAQTLVVQTVTSSILYSSGSNVFGNQLANTQTFTGSVNITGSVSLVGAITQINANTTSSFAGIVGINNNAPSNQLHIVGIDGSNFTDGIRVARNGTPSQYATLNMAGGTYNFLATNTTTGAPGFAWLTSQTGTSTTSSMVLNGSGYLGIGNASPSEFLTIGDSTNTSASRRAITLGGSGYGNPGNPNTGSNGDKVILFNSATGASGDMRLGVGTLGDLWYKSSVYHRFFVNNFDGSAVIEVMRIASGSIGIGTSTPSNTLQVVSSNINGGIYNTNSGGDSIGMIPFQRTNAGNFFGLSRNGQMSIFAFPSASVFSIGTQNANDMIFGTNDTERIRITSAGVLTFTGAATFSGNTMALTGANPGITLTGSQTNLYCYLSLNAGTASNAIYTLANSYATTGPYIAGALAIIGSSSAGISISSTHASGGIRFYSADTIRMTIPSSGGLYVSTDTASSPGGVAGLSNIFNPYNDGQWALALQNNASTNASARGLGIKFGNTFNNASNEFIWCIEGTTVRFYVDSDGGIRNYSANNSNLSDERVKKDIVPLESYWDKFKNIGIVKFKYKDQSHEDYNIGVIAQQVESIAPEFVSTDGFGQTPDDGIPLKSIYTEDLHTATIKVLQEAMAKIEELQEKLQRNNIN